MKYRMTTQLSVLMALLLVLTGCATPHKVFEQELQPLGPEHHPDSLPDIPTVKPKSTHEMLEALSVYQQAERPSFTFGKGDVMSVSVYGEPDLSVDQIPVRPDGRISFPLIGDIQAENREVEAVKEDIRTKLLRYLRAPRVAVIVREFNSLSYTIAGEVYDPGTFPLSTDVTLTQAVAGAGGLLKGKDQGTTNELADLTHAFVARDGEYLPVDFVQLFRNGDMRFDVKLFPGDYIFIPSGLAKEVFIVGEVKKPDLFAFTEGTTVGTAITSAQGFTPEADLSRVHIIRGTLTNPELYVLRLDKVLKGEARDMVLKAGDIVYIPPTGLTRWNRILSKLIPSVTAIQTGLLLERAASSR